MQHSTSGDLYVGLTENLNRRIQEHNRAGRKFTTRKAGSWYLVYAEAYRAREDAIVRERKLKRHGSAKQKLFKRLAKSLLNPKLGLGLRG